MLPLRKRACHTNLGGNAAGKFPSSYLRSRLTVWQVPRLIAPARQYPRLTGLNSHALSTIPTRRRLAGHLWREVPCSILSSRPHYFFSQRKFGARPFRKGSARRGRRAALRYDKGGKENYSLYTDQLASHGNPRHELRRHYCFAEKIGR